MPAQTPAKFDIFACRSSAKALRGYIASQPQKGRGVIKKLAETLGATSSQISQYASGRITPSLDHGFQIASHFGWDRRETEYWVALLEFERVGHYQAKDFFKDKLEGLRRESLNLSKDLSARQELTDEQKSRFYSSWLYSATRLLCSIGDGVTSESIRNSLSEVSKKELNEILEFLLQNRLILKEGQFYRIGTQHTWVAKNSSFIKQHHCNWRLRSIERAHHLHDEEFMLTSPMSISTSAAKSFRRELQEFTKNFFERLPASGDPEEVMCLNIDFFHVLARSN